MSALLRDPGVVHRDCLKLDLIFKLYFRANNNHLKRKLLHTRI